MNIALALPKTGRADTTPGYTKVGPAATLPNVVFARDGTIYATADWLFDFPTQKPVVIWRSRDHGRTWDAAYRLPWGWHVQVLEASPADPATLYAYQAAARKGSAGGAVRIDIRTGRAVPLPLGGWVGVDAAGTAYGLVATKSGHAIVLCRRTADACDRIESMSDITWATVDTGSAGVLVSTNARGGRNPTNLEVSTDGGATWSLGAPCTACYVRFGGPAPRTLYTATGDQLQVSHDAGLTWAATHPVPSGTTVVAGSNPVAVFGWASGSPFLVTTDDAVTTRAVSTPIAGQLVFDPTDASRMLVTGQDDTRISGDGGRTWRPISDPRFGFLPLDAATTGGAGRYIYSLARGSIWVSSDRGVTRTRTTRPSTEVDDRLLVSRDDPRAAHAQTTTATRSARSARSTAASPGRPCPCRPPSSSPGSRPARPCTCSRSTRATRSRSPSMAA